MCFLYFIRFRSIKLTLRGLPDTLTTSEGLCYTSRGRLKGKSWWRKLWHHENVAQRHYFHTSLWSLHDVLAKSLIQFLLQMLFLYWVIEMAFLLSLQNNIFKSELKQRWSWTFINVILAMIFRWKLNLTHWRGFNVDKTTFKESWEYLLPWFSLESGSITRLSYVLQHKAYIFLFSN